MKKNKVIPECATISVMDVMVRMKNSELTEIWLFMEEPKKTNYDIKFTHGFKSSQENKKREL